MQQFQHRSALLCTLAAGFLAACAHVSNDKDSGSDADAQDAVGLFTANAKIVRGLNQNMCVGDNVKNGAENHPAKATDIMDNLSVNCAESKGVGFKDLYKDGSTYQWTTTLGELRQANASVTLVADPIAGNDYHCLISNITANQFCSRGKVQSN